MEPPNERQMAIIARRARRALIQARYEGIRIDWSDLMEEGFFAYVKARKKYRKGHASGAMFDTYLGMALENTFKNQLRRERKRRHYLPTVSLDTADHDEEADSLYDTVAEEPSPGTETELVELVQHYCDMLDHRIDKEVLIEKVFPSVHTLTLAKIENLRAAHMVDAGLRGRQSPFRDIGISIDTLSRSLRYSVQQVKQALIRIRKVMRSDIS